MDDRNNQSQNYRQTDAIASASASANERTNLDVDVDVDVDVVSSAADYSTVRFNNSAEDIRTNTLGMSSFDSNARHRFGMQLRLAMALIDGSENQITGRQTDYGKQSTDSQTIDTSSTNTPSTNTPSTNTPSTKTPNTNTLNKASLDKDKPIPAMPSDATAIAVRLKLLGKDISSAHADQLELLVRYDELEGWRSSGARHCVAWMNLELGISQQLGWEYLRVGRQLRKLPITSALFRAGSLSWSIVRLISRVANAENEGGLCHAALDASVSEVDRLCQGYRWQDNDDTKLESENAVTLHQFNARSLTWNTASNGNTQIRLSLPPELAQAFLNSVEHSLAQLEYSKESADTMSQRRADAAVLMAETSLQSAEKQMAAADRYQVIVSVDASELKQDDESEAVTSSTASTDSVISSPAKRPSINGAGPIGRETARRLACDCSLTTITNLHGEPVDFGRKSRMWRPAMARAIKSRDQHCQFPGCTQTRHLQIHHIHHWADGGSTCIENGVCLCLAHHRTVHEGGYRIERVDDQPKWLDEQFIRQKAKQNVASTQITHSTSKIEGSSVTEIEALLRNSRESFDYVRQISPTRFRFRVVDSEGRDIRDRLNAPPQPQHVQAADSREEHKQDADEHASQKHEQHEKVQDEKFNKLPTRVYQSTLYNNYNKSVIEEERERYIAYA